MIFTKRCFLISVLLLASAGAFAQDPAFTQYNSAPLYLNPALAGSNGGLRAAAGHRIQWPELDGGFETSVVSFDAYLDKIKSGLGLVYLHDVTPGGTFVTDRIELDYAYHISNMTITRNIYFSLRPAISIAYYNKSLNWDELIFGSQVDPNTGVIGPSPYSGTSARNNVDIGTGMLMYGKRLSGGFSVHHLTEPDEGFIGKSPLPRKYVIHLAGTIGEPDSARHFAFTPHVLYMQQQDFQVLLTGVTAKYDKFLLGVAYRAEDAFIIQAGLQTPLFRIGYSYDHTISALSNAAKGSHEVMLAFDIFHKQEKKIDTPKMIAF